MRYFWIVLVVYSEDYTNTDIYGVIIPHNNDQIITNLWISVSDLEAHCLDIMLSTLWRSEI